MRQVISFITVAPTLSHFIDKLKVSAYISAPQCRRTHLAQVAELVDALVSGTSGAIRGGSSPLLGTIQNNKLHVFSNVTCQYRIARRGKVRIRLMIRRPA